MKISLFIARVGMIVLCCCQTWAQNGSIIAADRISTDVEILCVPDGLMFSDHDGFFWIINGLVYGLLQIPNEFVVCSAQSCDLTILTIPVVLGTMNGSTFQCVSIDYHTNTVYQGGRTELMVISLDETYYASLQNITEHSVLGNVTELELDYTQYSVGPVNTSISIGWTYSNLTCEPAVFIIEGYDDRDAILLADHVHPTPVLTLNSTSTLVLFPTSYITNSSLYLRLLAYDVTGTNCAQDSAKIYYQLNDHVTKHVPISPDGVTCIPIPVELSSTHDYSSLEVLWPEKHNSTGKLCYCPPFEGEYHLFSRCIYTTSCDTDYSITVRNNSVCFAGLSHELANIPVYFTLLDPCTNHRCIIRSVVTAFMIVLNETNLNTTHEDTTTTQDTLEDTISTTLKENKKQSPQTTMILIAVMSAIFVIVLLLSLPPTVVCLCRQAKKHKYDLNTSERDTNLQVYEVITDENSHATNQRQTEELYSSINNINPAQTSMVMANEAHRIYDVITNENAQTTNESQTKEPYRSININPPLPPLQICMVVADEAHRVYDIITNKNLPLPQPSDEPVYNTLQYKINTHSRNNERDVHPSQSKANAHTEIEGAYDIITSAGIHINVTDKPKTASFSTLDKGNMSNPESLDASSSKAEGIGGLYKEALYSILDKGNMSNSDDASSSKAEGIGELHKEALYSTLDKGNMSIGGLHKEASYSTLDKGNMSNSESLDASLSKAEGIGELHKEALYSTVDKTKKKKHDRMTTAESLNADPTDSEVNTDTTDKPCKEAVYSTVDKTKRDGHYHMITVESLNADSIEVNDSMDKNDQMITADSLNADSTEDATDGPCKESDYSTVDKSKRNINYFMITADNIDSDSCEAEDTSELIPEWGDCENMTASQNTTTILDVSHIPPKCTNTSAVEGQCEAIGIKVITQTNCRDEKPPHSLISPNCNPKDQHPPISPNGKQ